jgi:hypothetical protein
MKIVLFKRRYRMLMTLQQEGTQRVKPTGTGRQKGGMFGESTGPVDNVPSDAPLWDIGIECTLVRKWGIN